MIRPVFTHFSWQTSSTVPPPDKLDVVFDSLLLPALCQIMTSSTKPEVHSIPHCRQRRTEPRPQVTRIENLMKFGSVVFELWELTDSASEVTTIWRYTNVYIIIIIIIGHTDRQTDRYDDCNTSYPYRRQTCEAVEVIRRILKRFN